MRPILFAILGISAAFALVIGGLCLSSVSNGDIPAPPVPAMAISDVCPPVIEVGQVAEFRPIFRGGCPGGSCPNGTCPATVETPTPPACVPSACGEASAERVARRPLVAAAAGLRRVVFAPARVFAAGVERRQARRQAWRDARRED